MFEDERKAEVYADRVLCSHCNIITCTSLDGLGHCTAWNDRKAGYLDGLAEGRKDSESEIENMRKRMIATQKICFDSCL